jgi:cell division transport system ATP-binding protein
MIEFKSVAKKFGSVVALDKISFKVDDGEFVFLTGPSGAGKTTLLKLIMAEILADSGDVIVNNVDISKLKSKEIPKYRQGLGTVFQDFKILTERTVEENVEVALAVIGVPQKDWDERTRHVLKLVGLSRQSNLFPSQLSGGELQRVSLARALSVNPKIVLADEPTGNLDWETSDNLMKLLEKINQEGKTILMATHNLEIVKKYKMREIHIEAGKISK